MTPIRRHLDAAKRLRCPDSGVVSNSLKLFLLVGITSGTWRKVGTVVAARQKSSRTSSILGSWPVAWSDVSEFQLTGARNRRHILMVPEERVLFLANLYRTASILKPVSHSSR